MTTVFKRYERIAQGYDPKFNKLDYETREYIQYLVAKQVETKVREKVAHHMDALLGKV